MAKAAKPGKRIVLQLDTRVRFEALILNRLERIPEAATRVVARAAGAGFRYECQTLRGGTGCAERSPTHGSIQHKGR